MLSEKPPPEVAEVRKQLGARIRDDWAFEWAGHTHDGASNLQPNGTQPSPEIQTLPVSSAMEQINEWRERMYGSSDTGTDGELGNNTTLPHKSNQKQDNLKKFAPGLSAQETEASLQERFLKRQQRMEEEIGWNQGLAHWTAQRDAWTCAKHLRASIHAPQPLMEKSTSKDDSTSVPSQPCNPAIPSPPSSPSSSPPSTIVGPPQPQSNSHPSPTTPASTPPTGLSPITKTLIPVAPPLLPETDPVRASISPRLYPSIFQKVVLQSQAPTVPINLLHLTRALVEGWKRSGEWPPKTTAATTSPAGAHNSGNSKTSPLTGARSASGSHGPEHGHSRSGSGSLLALLHDGTASAGQRLGRRGKRLFVARGGEGGGFGNRNVSTPRPGAAARATAAAAALPSIPTIPVFPDDEEQAVVGSVAVDGVPPQQTAGDAGIELPVAFGARSRDVAKRVGRKLRLSLSGGSFSAHSDTQDGVV